MRFVRVYTRTDTGEIINVTEAERPFPRAMALRVDGAPFEIEMHELGLSARFFNPKTLDGRDCTVAEHLHLRLERDPQAADHAAENLDRPGGAHFRVRQGHEHEVPDFIDVPTTLEGIATRVRDRGVASGLKGKARAWLAYILDPHEVNALGLPGLPLSVFKAIDNMRSAREPRPTGTRMVMERSLQQRSDVRRQMLEAANRHREEREAERIAAAAKREWGDAK